MSDLTQRVPALAAMTYQSRTLAHAQREQIISRGGFASAVLDVGDGRWVFDWWPTAQAAALYAEALDEDLDRAGLLRGAADWEAEQEGAKGI